MKKEVEEEKFFPFWTQDNKWGGLFEVEWIFIKDVPFYHVRHLNFPMNDGLTRPISYSRDAQEVPFEQAKEFIEIFESFVNTNTILEHFEYYDIRQENYERMFPVKQMENLKIGG
jgi:YTH domain-containing family protein